MENFNASVRCLLPATVLEHWPGVLCVKITFEFLRTISFVCKEKFDEMLCKLDSTEFARSFGQSPSLPWGIHPIIHQYDEDVLATGYSLTAGVTFESLLWSLSPCTTLSLLQVPQDYLLMPVQGMPRYLQSHTHTRKEVSLQNQIKLPPWMWMCLWGDQSPVYSALLMCSMWCCTSHKTQTFTETCLIGMLLVELQLDRHVVGWVATGCLLSCNGWGFSTLAFFGAAFLASERGGVGMGEVSKWGEINKYSHYLLVVW